MQPNYSVEIQVNGKAVATKKSLLPMRLPPTTVVLSDSQLAPGVNQIRMRSRVTGAVLVGARRVLLEREESRESGTFKLSTARQYYKLTSSRRRKVVYHLDSLSGRCRSATLWRCADRRGNDWRT